MQLSKNILRNPWRKPTEPWGSAEPRSRNTGLGFRAQDLGVRQNRFIFFDLILMCYVFSIFNQKSVLLFIDLENEILMLQDPGTKYCHYGLPRKMCLCRLFKEFSRF
jgi:hypothetical protein